jgi:hypothetical protein
MDLKYFSNGLMMAFSDVRGLSARKGRIRASRQEMSMTRIRGGYQAKGANSRSSRRPMDSVTLQDVPKPFNETAMPLLICGVTVTYQGFG